MSKTNGNGDKEQRQEQQKNPGGPSVEMLECEMLQCPHCGANITGEIVGNALFIVGQMGENASPIIETPAHCDRCGMTMNALVPIHIIIGDVRAKNWVPGDPLLRAKEPSE